jgi:hypothetical protein
MDQWSIRKTITGESMTTIYAAVTRHLKGHATPVVSLIIPCPPEPQDVERSYGNDDSLPHWMEHYFTEKAREHKDMVCAKLMEFKSAVWMLEVIEVHAGHEERIPRNLIYTEL